MFSFPSSALAMSVLLAGAADAAEPFPSFRCPVTARVDVAPEPSEMAPEVCVSADEPTTFFFDSKVAVGAVEFQPEGGLADWGQGKEGTSLLVVPKAGYLPEERVRVTVRFAEGTVPASASFWLVGHAARGTRRVEVYRQPRPADALRREAADAQAEARQCREEKAQLLSERREPGGLMGAAWLAKRGAIASRDIDWSRHLRRNALSVASGKMYSYTHQDDSRATSLSAWLRLTNPDATPWTAAGGVLVDSAGEQVDLSAWQAAPIPAGGEGDMVVGTERGLRQLACPCTLKIWESPGTRVVTLDNVELPVAPASGR